MKVVLYHPWIYVKSGLERTILEIARRSRHEIEIVTSHYDAAGTYPELKDFGIREIDRVSVSRQYGSVIDAARRIARARLDLDDADALLVCCDGIGTLITLRNRSVPAVNLCFTPLRAVYDQEYRRRHLAQQRGKRLIALMIEAIYRWIDRAVWSRYSKVVCISETVRDRVAAAGLRARSEPLVAYPGIDEGSIRASDQRENMFFLPGRIMWTKNIDLGIKAFRQFYENGRQEYELVVAGMVDAKSEAYFEQLKALAASCPGIRFLVDPTDQVMREYYARCCSVLFTAFNEDLGLTPMEGMSNGKPVIAVNRGGPREVVEHNKTGLLLPDDVNSFALGMECLAARPDLAKRFGEAGIARVQRFTWKQFVSDLDDILDSVN